MKTILSFFKKHNLWDFIIPTLAYPISFYFMEEWLLIAIIRITALSYCYDYMLWYFTEYHVPHYMVADKPKHTIWREIIDMSRMIFLGAWYSCSVVLTFIGIFSDHTEVTRMKCIGVGIIVSMFSLLVAIIGRAMKTYLKTKGLPTRGLSW